MSASKIHMKWLRSSITELIKIKGHTCERKPKKSYQTTSVWELKFGKKDSIKLLSWIYYDSNLPCLKRKREIAQRFI